MVLIAVDAHHVAGLLDLPGIHTRTPADLGEEKVERLLESVAAMLPRGEQELPRPAHLARLVLRQRQVLVAQAVSEAVEYR